MGDVQGQAFRRLKAPLASYPCLGTIKRHGQLVVDTDARDVANGKVLHRVRTAKSELKGT